MTQNQNQRSAPDVALWWRTRARSAKALLISGTATVVLSLYLPHAAWFMYWHNNLTGGTFDISQAHAYGSNPLVQALTVPGSVQADAFATANGWFTFLICTLVVGIVLLLVGALKAYIDKPLLHRGVAGTPRLARAGWYADPSGPAHTQRMWNGETWTASTRREFVPPDDGVADGEPVSPSK